MRRTVSIELALDGWLAESSGVPPRYREALDGVAAYAEAIVWRGPPRPDRLLEVCARVTAARVPARYAEPDFVAARTVRALASRPRLALTGPEIAGLERAIADQQPRVRAAGPALMAAAAAAPNDGGTATPG